jgi:hypothetical protein
MCSLKRRCRKKYGISLLHAFSISINDKSGLQKEGERGKKEREKKRAGRDRIREKKVRKENAGGRTRLTFIDDSLVLKIPLYALFL